jgi:hypothetical protein
VGKSHYIDLVRDIVPGFLRANAHQGKELEAAFEAGDGVA